MPQWEYRSLDLNAVPRRGSSEDVLNGAGGDGWELVAVVVTGIAYLKRHIPEVARPRRRATSSAHSAGE